jgi:hypothetical protein
MQRLQAVGDEHEELYDTETRDAMGAAIFDGFLWPEPAFEVPGDFGLATPEANASVQAALRDYIAAARALAPQVGISTFQQRLAALQDTTVWTADGGTHDEFFGSYAACMYDEDGNWQG